jgi:hypothetical protein
MQVARDLSGTIVDPQLTTPTSCFPDRKWNFRSRLGNYLHRRQAHWHRRREVALNVSCHQTNGIEICYHAKLTPAVIELLPKAQFELRSKLTRILARLIDLEDKTWCRDTCGAHFYQPERVIRSWLEALEPKPSSEVAPEAFTVETPLFPVLLHSHSCY